MRQIPRAILVALLFSEPAWAHHAFEAEFDRSKPVTLVGTVTRIEWSNPHVLVHLDVNDGGGRVVAWRVQAGSPGVLTVNGWTRETLRPGMAIRVEGFGAKLDVPLVHGTELTRADGRTWCINVPCRHT
jgi:hypothetical protein